jgi:plastocyanin
LTKKLLIALATLSLAAFALAACGDDGSTSASTAADTSSSSADTASSGGGGTVAVEADPDGALAFTETELSADAGANTIDFDNPSTTPHNVFVEDDGGKVVAETDTITGSTTTASADLAPGTYTYYCSIPGHREAGMEGTLTVK